MQRKLLRSSSCFYTNDNTKKQDYKNDLMYYVISMNVPCTHWNIFCSCVTTYTCHPQTFWHSIRIKTDNYSSSWQVDSVSWYAFLKYPASDAASEEHGSSRRVFKILDGNTISALGRPHWHHHLMMNSLFSYSLCRNFFHWRKFLGTYQRTL
jgi:hypothetical protein